MKHQVSMKSVSGRIASSAWWFFTMILMASYTANLAAFLTSEKLEASIDTVDKLAKQTKVKYGIQGGGSTEAFFKHSTVSTYKKMWQFMSNQVPPVMVDSYDEGIRRVRDSKGQYAFLLEGTSNEYENTRKPCDTMKVGDPLNSLGYGVATPFGSDLRMPINLAILELAERGVLKKLEIKWWYDRGQCEQGLSTASQSVSLNLSKVAGIFYILIAGMVAAMMASCGELFYRGHFDEEKEEVAQKLLNFTEGIGVMAEIVRAVAKIDFESEFTLNGIPLNVHIQEALPTVTVESQPSRGGGPVRTRRHTSAMNVLATATRKKFEEQMAITHSEQLHASIDDKSSVCNTAV